MSAIKIDPNIKYLEGTQRVFDPETTLANTMKLLPKIGVTRIANITDLDRVGIPVFSAIRPSAAAGAISIYSGKGSTETNARISAIMESFERCLAEQPEVSVNLSGVKLQTETVTDTYESLCESYPTLYPDALLLPQRVAEFTKLEWIMGDDILNDVEVFVPANAVFHPYEPRGGNKLFRSNTNGLASGNTIEEAILHGLLEVIERDSLSISEYTRNPGKEIVLTEKDGLNYTLKRKLEAAGINVKIWLLDSDIDIPTVVTALDDVVLKDPALLVMGAGSHLTPEIAVTRALTEAAQSRVVQIHGAREDTDREQVVRTFGYDHMKRMNSYWYEDLDKVHMDELEDISNNTPAANIKTVLERLDTIADGAIIVNLSRGVDIPVVRAIIPMFELYTLDRERKGDRIKKKKKRVSK
ncbi:MAG: YcaO-like family protein [Candidatus Methanoperedens nitroreducens]|uniref:YcaO-like family protein n=1 Tax=Candidatus Methanoperedens nitratireducens TaxID=1392998 RepID=A0A0P7ZDH8_9EURY|nr:YcaO-related McrA-glycine thioamidation protein [Candidatus Methanoperedens sp. BLZ2]KAB2948083.1 MAG: YcaO-related McrA-glycine thioamidation protein [Candidatus Methanoperedens sp.]KPQ42736.1 MAG: YcaO-like family protein [Candidatus Methanoperedens sp. BLZ1]MBZ0176398.1 YcaO-related McrA-glycine thioamidation protein [Candidatus Methanoperedens nitroreducens]MCX9077942.1 YcaO-related McrA-glycine thioamidation protein [Candidatus Methanoperedens sp.]